MCKEISGTSWVDNRITCEPEKLLDISPDQFLVEKVQEAISVVRINIFLSNDSL